MLNFLNSVPQPNSTFIFEHGGSVLWIQLVVAVLSIVGSGSIIVFALFQNLLGNREDRTLFFLSLADFLLCFTWLIGLVLLNQTFYNIIACYNLHAVEQIFYISSFFYTLNYTWVLYMRMKEDYRRNMTGQSTLHPGRTCLLTNMAPILSCTLPVLLMIPVFIVGNSSNCARNLSEAYECLLVHTWALNTSSGATPCGQIHTYSIAIFVTSFAISSCAISVLMGMAHSLYTRCIAAADSQLEAREWARLGVLKRQMKLYFIVFAVCWVPAVLLAISILSNLQENHWLYVFLYMLQAFTSPSQGLLNCLLCGWTQQRFRSLRAMEQRDADTQTPLLRSQKPKAQGADAE